MAFCSESIKFPYFTVSRLYRDNASMHYAFVGLDMAKKHNELFKNMSNGNIPEKNNINMLKNIFGNYTVDIWISAIKNREPLIFINDMLWTDDTIFTIKTKLFVYLSKPSNLFVLQNYQQLWMKSNDSNKLLGVFFEKDTNNSIELVKYEPAVYDKPNIDTSILSEDDEFINLQVESEDNMLLFDIISKTYEFNNSNQYNPHIFMYVLTDEFDWVQNNPLIENNTPVSKKRLWNGYFKKHWPFANPTFSSQDTNMKLYTDSKNKLLKINEIISSIRNNNDDMKYPQIKDCVISKMTLWTRPPKNDSPYHLDMIYNYLRTLLSEEIPFIYYLKNGDKAPNVSIYKKSIDNKTLLPEKIDSWIFKKIPTGQKIPKGKAGSILIKIYNYSTEEGVSKYITLTLFRNSQISIGLSFEEYKQSSINDIENAISKVTKLVKSLNNNFLIYNKHPLYSVPELKIKDGEFIFSKYTSMQFYQIITTFNTKNIIEFNNLSNFLENYRPFVNISLFSEFEENNNVNLKLQYKRISYDDKLLDIFDFIKKEKQKEVPNDVIVNLIIKQFGKTITRASEIFNYWKIVQTNKKIAKEILKSPGVNIELKRSDDFYVKNKNKNNYKYKIFISGLKSLYILRNCYSFLQKVLSIYFNNYKKIVKQNIIEQKDINIDFGFNNNIKNIQNIQNIQNKQNFDLNINTNNFLSTNFNENLKPNINKVNTNSKIDFSSTENINLSDESMIDPKIRLKCSKEENKLVQKGVCKDICEFQNFKLKRLQQIESKIFNFRPKGKNDPYSRLCEIKKRPIIVSYDPNDEKKIDKKSFTYSLKYGSNPKKEYHYICPQAWCPTCEIPIPLESVKDIKIKTTNDGPCEYGTCPNGNHQVLLNRNNPYIYPGLLERTGNPDGFCMPCCFKKNKLNSKRYKECVRTDINENSNNYGKRYISRREKIPLAVDRFGLLPEDVESFLEQKNCDTGNIKSGFDCLVRKGVELSKINSFLNVMIDVVSGILNQKITRQQFIEKLTNNINEQLFKSLSGGLIKRQFNTKKNYIDFLLTTEEKIPDIYIWDLVSRPGIFTKEGFNIVIFTQHSIYCPMGQNSSYLYSLDKPTLLIIKYGNIYEPIYRVKNTNSKISYTCLQNSLEPIIQKVIETAKKGCLSYDEIYWEKASYVKKTYEVKESITLKDLIKAISDKYTIKLQLVDDYSKTTGVILNNDLYLPVKPSVISMNYPYLDFTTNLDIPLLSFDKTIKLLDNFIKETNLNFNPIYIVIDKRNTEMISGILLETNRVIPVIPIKISKIKTKMKTSNIFYYPDVDTKNISNTIKLKRINTINEYKYNIEAFERFKYEISRFLQTKNGNNDKDKITEITEKPIISRKDIDNLNNIIQKITKKILATPEESKKKIKSIVDSNKKYKSSLLRTACFSLDKNLCYEDTHCVYKGNKCKLVDLIKTDFVERLIDILLRYPIQRYDILLGTISMIDLQSSHQKNQPGEILLSGNKIDENFNKIVSSDLKKYQLKLIKNIDMIQPSFKGVNKKAFLRVRKGMEKDIKTYSVADLSQHWLSIMNPTYRMISSNYECDSLYYIIVEYAKQINISYIKENKNYEKRKDIDIENITFNNIKDVYSNFILTIEIDDLHKIVKNVLQNLNKDDIQNIFDVSDFYNIFNENNKVNSVDELAEKIKVGENAYKLSRFDVIMFSYMLNIHIILLRSSISEVIGTGIVDNDLYAVLFYDPLVSIPCIRFYMLQKGAIPYISSLNSELKRLIKI